MAAALAVVVAVMVGTNLATRGGGDAAVAETASPEVAARPVVEAPQRPVAGEPPPDLRNVNAYMLQHMQQKAVNHPDVGAFAKLVTFEPEAQR